jgi:hypothetical protein
MDTWVWIAIAAAVALLLLVLIGSVWRGRRRRRRLKQAFGPEYERTVARTGKRQEAERRLEERERRHEEIELHELSGPSRARLEEEWRALQARFLDDPEGSARAAESLVVRVMEERGYPTAEDREQRAADLSVENPHAVSAYRRGCALLDGVHESPDATETLRQSMRSFRTAFEEVLDSRVREEALA